jgi:hypothetical protein
MSPRQPFSEVEEELLLATEKLCPEQFRELKALRHPPPTAAVVLNAAACLIGLPDARNQTWSYLKGHLLDADHFLASLKDVSRCALPPVPPPDAAHSSFFTSPLVVVSRVFAP